MIRICHSKYYFYFFFSVITRFSKNVTAFSFALIVKINKYIYVQIFMEAYTFTYNELKKKFLIGKFQNKKEVSSSALFFACHRNSADI